MSVDGKNILALIPAYNEAERITPTIQRTLQYLPVLVVDDGSTDHTPSLAKTAGAAVLSQRPNQGKGAALRAGFFYAFERGYDAVVTLDADGQHDPAEIPKFMDAFSANVSQPPDLVIGARNYHLMPIVRRTSNTIGRWMISWSMGQTIPDNQSGYRLISRRLMEVLQDSDEQNFEFEVEMIAICLKQGYILQWVPIQTIYAGEGSHIRPLRHLMHWFRIVWKTRQIMKK